MIEMYFDFRLYRLWKTRQHSKLLDYEDFLWQRNPDNNNNRCSRALQCHEEPVKADPMTRHCSTVVLDPSTQYKTYIPAFIQERTGRGGKGMVGQGGWRPTIIMLCLYSSSFPELGSKTNKKGRKNTNKRKNEGKAEAAGLRHCRRLALPLSLKAKRRIKNSNV